MIESCVIEITKDCPLNCIGCYYYNLRKNDKNNMLTLNNFKRIISKLPNTIDSYSISGGEPFLNPELLNMCEYLNTTKGKKPLIFTSGYIYNPELLIALKPLIYQLEITIISCENELESLWRKKIGVFNNVKLTINYCYENNIPVLLHFIVSNINKDLLWKINDFAKEYEVEALVLPFISPNKILKRFMLNKKEWKNIRKEIPTYPNLLYGMCDSYCVAGVKRASIDLDGTVYPCVYLNDKIGNIYKEEWQDIYDNLCKWRMGYGKLKRECLGMKRSWNMEG